jgi:hypothetical protein
VDLGSPAIELYFVQPLGTDRRSFRLGRGHGANEREGSTQHGRDVHCKQSGATTAPA